MSSVIVNAKPAVPGNIMGAKVGESDQELLVLVDCARVARVVCDGYGLPHPFDPQRVIERIALLVATQRFDRTHPIVRRSGALSLEAYRAPWISKASDWPAEYTLVALGLKSTLAMLPVPSTARIR